MRLFIDKSRPLIINTKPRKPPNPDKLLRRESNFRMQEAFQLRGKAGGIGLLQIRQKGIKMGKIIAVLRLRGAAHIPYGISP